MSQHSLLSSEASAHVIYQYIISKNAFRRCADLITVSPTFDLPSIEIHKYEKNRTNIYKRMLMEMVCPYKDPNIVRNFWLWHRGIFQPDLPITPRIIEFKRTFPQQVIFLSSRKAQENLLVVTSMKEPSGGKVGA